MNAQRRIDPDVREVLSEMTLEGCVLLAFPSQLPRDLYVRLNKVLEALGGKWRRGSSKAAAGHVFEKDPAERIEAAIATGSYDCPRLFDFFRTPAWLAKQMVDAAQLPSLARVLEPSAGDGALVREIIARHGDARVDMVEALPSNREDLLRLAESAAVLGTKVELVGVSFDVFAPRQEYDAVIMNPPFSGRRDVTHVMRASTMVKRGGIVVAVVSAGVGFRRDKATVALRELAEACGDLVPLPDGTFSEAGTEVRTMLLTMIRPT